MAKCWWWGLQTAALNMCHHFAVRFMDPVQSIHHFLQKCPLHILPLHTIISKVSKYLSSAQCVLAQLKGKQIQYTNEHKVPTFSSLAVLNQNHLASRRVKLLCKLLWVWGATGTILVTIKLPFYTCAYAHTCIRATLVPISALRLYPYLCYAYTCSKVGVMKFLQRYRETGTIA